MKKEVWTTYRKLMANLVPACFFVPVFAAGLMLFQRGMTAPALACVAATPLVGWIATNYLGLWENRKMMSELRPLLPSGVSGTFAGFAPPGRVSPLDPHHDLGWLVVHPDRIEFIGEKGRHELQKAEVKAVRFRPNVHSWVGLGRWVSIEGVRDLKSVRMLVEPRSESTLLRNRAFGRTLVRDLRRWMAS